MNQDLLILIIEAIAVYLLVLWTHSLRQRFGLAPFYAVLGSITAIMSWVTDAGVVVEWGGITFMVGSTVFYTSLLLGVFVVYVFDGPRPTRIAILTIAGVSLLVPLIALVLHLQVKISGQTPLGYVPIPNLRINSASILTTIADLLFLAMAWEVLGKPRMKLQLWMRAFLTLLGVMWLDVILFATGAFAGSPEYLSIMQGTLLSRLIISLFAGPFLYAYLAWQNTKADTQITNRPVLAILREVAEVRLELENAQGEIERRKKLEAENQTLIAALQAKMERIRRLEGLLPVCANCHRVRVAAEDTNEAEKWLSLEEYVRTETDTEFSHGVCRECLQKLYPDLSADVIANMQRNPE